MFVIVVSLWLHWSANLTNFLTNAMGNRLNPVNVFSNTEIVNIEMAGQLFY